MKKSILFFVCLMLCFAMACRKKDLPIIITSPKDSTIIPETEGKLKISIKNMIGSKSLNLGPANIYRLSNGDSLSVNSCNYYLSNFVFTDENGKRFSEPESYHLVIAENDATLDFTVKKVPFGKYKSVEFLIGVDSLKNVSGAQGGDLDPKFGMFWDWNNGYIMAKLEGTSPQSSNFGNAVMFHIAGFKGDYKVLQTVNLSLPVNAVVAPGKTPSVIINANIATWFESFFFPGFARLSMVNKVGASAQSISLGYRNMMQIKEVLNP